MEHLYLKIKETLEKSYSLYSITFTSSDWKCTLDAVPNLSKLNVYHFFHPDSSNPKTIISLAVDIESSQITTPAKKKIRNKADKVRTTHMKKQTRRK